LAFCTFSTSTATSPLANFPTFFRLISGLLSAKDPSWIAQRYKVRNTNIHTVVLNIAGTALFFAALTVLRAVAVLLFLSQKPKAISQPVVVQDDSMSWDGD
jgi:hypothetical protein